MTDDDDECAPHPDAAFGILIEYDAEGAIVCISTTDDGIPVDCAAMCAAGLRDLADKMAELIPGVVH